MTDGTPFAVTLLWVFIVGLSGAALAALFDFCDSLGKSLRVIKRGAEPPRVNGHRPAQK